MKGESGLRRKKLYLFFSEQCGSTIILAAFIMLGLLACVALALDGGTMYITKIKLQKAANAAALSGAQELANQQSAVFAIVQKILKEHDETNSLVSTTIEMEHKVKVHLKKQVPLPFSRLLGFQNLPIEVKAAAEIQSIGKSIGAVPLGMDDSIPLEYNREYKIKVEQAEDTPGIFLILVLGEAGAKSYEDTLRNGYPNELEVGDIIDTQKDNLASETRSIIQERIDACPDLPLGSHPRECPRIILVPVYKPYNMDSSQLKQIKITGFAYFYITKPMSSNDMSITGRFMKKAGTGTPAPDAVNKGAFSIRLTE